MQRSNLKLETYFVERLSWSLVEGFDPRGRDFTKCPHIGLEHLPRKSIALSD